MYKIAQLLKFLLDPHNIFSYISLSTVFLLLAITGAILFFELFKTKNKLKTFGGGMITGASAFLLLISITSYIFKGAAALKTTFILYSLTILIFAFKKKNNYKILLKTKLDIAQIATVLVIACYLVLFALYAGNVVVGADIATYLGISSSIARGNYPTVLPWQPEYLTTYHHGAFMLQGAVHAISGVDVSVTHFVFAIYLLWALFLYLVGLAREKTRSFLCLVPAVCMLVVFGPIYIAGGITGDITHLHSLSTSTLKESIALFTQFFELKASIGAGATNAGGFVYSTFMGFGTAIVLLFVDIVISKYRNTQPSIKHALLIVIMMLSLSITVTFFLLLAAIYPFVFLKDFFKQDIRKIYKKLIVLGFVALSLFFTLQNSIRDGLFVPQPEIPRFTFLKTNDAQLSERKIFLQDKLYVNQIDKNNLTTWYVPNAFWFALIIFLAAIIIRSNYAITLTIVAFFCLFFALTSVNTYWPSNGLRFISKAYNFATTATGFLLISLALSKNKVAKLTAIILCITFIPAIINSHLYLVQMAFADSYSNLTNGISRKNDTLEWITKNIPYNKRVLFVDDYPYKATYSVLTNEALQYYGIFVPIAPSSYKVLNAEASGEWFDAVTQLSPYSIKSLKIDTVFITTIGKEHLSPQRLKQIEDISYFNKIYSNPAGEMFEIKPAFKEIADDPAITLHTIVQSIPDHARVYLGAISQDEIRKEMILQLAKRTQLSGLPYSIAKDYFMYIETTLPFIGTTLNEKQSDIDYAILQRNSNPQDVLTGEYTKIIEHEFITLWKKN